MTTRQPIDLESPAPRLGSQEAADHVEQAEKPLKQAEAVIRLIEESAELFHDPAETPYAIVRVPKGGRRVLRLRSRAMRSWIARTARQTLGRPVGSGAIDEALVALEGIARYDRDERKVHLRVAEHGGAIYVDLGDDTGAGVEVMAGGWRMISDPPVLFRRPDPLRALPRPEQGGSLDDLRPFVNAADEDALHLFVAWLIAAYRPGRPFPVLALHGEQGTAKSTASRLARALIDPNASPVRSAPRKEDDLIVAAVHSHVIALDNLSGVQPWLSDALCRLATGGGLSKRQLYTDDEETVLDAIRPVIVNGIDDLANRADLAERCLVLTLRPIPKARRRDELTFWSAFEAAAPRILGYLLDGVASALRELPHTHLDELPRMADFARWIAAAEPGLGLPRGTLTGAYARNQAHVVDVALDASPVVTALVKLLDQPRHAEGWEGEPSHLLVSLTQVTPDETRRSNVWPKTPRALRSALTRSGSFLRAVGITLELDRREGHTWRRVWRISRGELAAKPSASSASSATGKSQSETADTAAVGTPVETVVAGDLHIPVRGADANSGCDGRQGTAEEPGLADGADHADGLTVPPDSSTFADWLDDQGIDTAKGNGNR